MDEMDIQYVPSHCIYTHDCHGQNQSTPSCYCCVHNIAQCYVDPGECQRKCSAK
jgi:hypothetical protein